MLIGERLRDAREKLGTTVEKRWRIDRDSIGTTVDER
jgi:hypothetical protein